MFAPDTIDADDLETNVKSTEGLNASFHFRARRLIAQWANKLDPDLIVKHRDIAGLTPDELAMWDKQKERIRDIAKALRHAFETEDEYERDWFLTWARCVNARYLAPFGLGHVEGVIPMARDSFMERAIYHVQKYVPDSMAFCRGKDCNNPCFFRRKAKQKLCGKRCRLASIAGSKRKSYLRKQGRSQS